MLLSGEVEKSFGGNDIPDDIIDAYLCLGVSEIGDLDIDDIFEGIGEN
jgi:hypothetical protein